MARQGLRGTGCMPICIECGAAVDSLYTEYSKGNICLTRCVPPMGAGFV